MQPFNDRVKELGIVSPESSSYFSDLGNSQKQCRICFESKESSSHLISACKCTGSIKFIHEECLKKWITLRLFDPLNYKCDICKTPLKMELKSRLVPSCIRLKSKILSLIIIPFVLCIFTNFTVLMVFLLWVSVPNPKVSIFVKLFFFMVLCSCSFIVFTLFRKFVKAVKIGCCRRKIIHWKIFEEPGNDEQDSTVLDENCQNFAGLCRNWLEGEIKGEDENQPGGIEAFENKGNLGYLESLEHINRFDVQLTSD